MPHIDLAQLLADHITDSLDRDQSAQECQRCSAKVIESAVQTAIGVMQEHGYTLSEAVTIGNRATDQVRASLVARRIQRILPDLQLNNDTPEQKGEIEQPILKRIEPEEFSDRIDEPLKHEELRPASHFRRRLRPFRSEQSDCSEEVLAAAKKLASRES